MKSMCKQVYVRRRKALKCCCCCKTEMNILMYEKTFNYGRGEELKVINKNGNLSLLCDSKEHNTPVSDSGSIYNCLKKNERKRNEIKNKMSM